MISSASCLNFSGLSMPPVFRISRSPVSFSPCNCTNTHYACSDDDRHSSTRGRACRPVQTSCVHQSHLTTRLFRTRAGAHSLVEPDSACLVVSHLAVMTRGVAMGIFKCRHIHHPSLVIHHNMPACQPIIFKAQIGDGRRSCGAGRGDWRLRRLSRQKPRAGSARRHFVEWQCVFPGGVCCCRMFGGISVQTGVVCLYVIAKT